MSDPNNYGSGSMGGVKYDAGKPRFDLIPVYPIEELARVYTIGAVKYGERNMERGLSWGRVFRAMLSHAWKWWRGEQFDAEDGQHHLASVAWCAFTLMDYQKRYAGTDDRAPPYPEEPPKPITVDELADKAKRAFERALRNADDEPTQRRYVLNSVDRSILSAISWESPPQSDNPGEDPGDSGGY